ncbi:MAG: alkaline phosphatase family protein, partial [Blastocatellia bacterium]
YWRAENAEDRKVIRALSTPGLLTEAERAVGQYTDGNDYSVEGDLRRAPFSTYILKTKRPGFMVCYFGALDEEEHKSGPYSPQAFAVLEKLDSIIGRIRSAAVESGGGHAFVCVVSDHGFMRTDKEVNLNSALRQAGLIEVDEKGSVKSWRAFAWYAGGSAGIMVRDRSDEAARKKATEVMIGLVSNQSSGVDRIIYPSAIPSPGGFPDSAFVVTLKPGYRLGTKLQGPVTLAALPGGTHGYAPDVVDMNSSFFIIGPGIGAHQDLGQIDMRDIAPTLAGLMGLELPAAEGHDLKVSLKALFTGPATMANGTAQPATGAR